ncbi:outer dense fiber protein 2-like isoform X2 [Heptranchias perlo]|uniref:outer dense fiber protein 2-like isoform X2 n=1 Tax=Heptranchias perlo TaxID=212740 RepID=UPI00355A0847
MKSRSSSPPIHVHTDESTPVRVHIRKSKLLPSVVELSCVSKGKPSTDSAKAKRSLKGKTKSYWKPQTSVRGQSYKQEGPAQRLTITLGDAEKISAVIHSGDASFDKEVDIHERMNQYGQQIDSLMEDLESLKTELSGHRINEQVEEDEDEPNTSKWTTEDHEAELSQELTRSTYKNRTFQKSFEKLQEELDLMGLEKEGLAEENMLLTALKEAEMASTSAAKQVATLKNSIAELIQVNQLSASGVGRFAGEKDLLMEKLESFKIANQKLQYLYRELRNLEPSMDHTNRQLEVLTQKLTRSETENIHLKRKLLETERNAKEVSELRQMEKDNSYFVKQISKSVDATRARLQGQLRNKEAESNRMSVQIQRFERTIIDHKLQIEHLKSQLSDVKEKAEEDKEVLKKATRAQKRRAERFEVAMENLNSQVKDKDVKLLEARLTLDTWKKQHDLAVEDKAQLETEIISLSNRVAGLKEQLQSTTESTRATNHELLEKLHTNNLENSNLRLENAQLKASVSALEEKAAMTATELEQLKAKVKQEEEVVMQYETQVQLLQTTANELKASLREATEENSQIRNMRDMETEKAKDQMETRLKELEAFPELLKVAERRLHEYEKNLLCHKRRFFDLSKTLIKLQMKADDQSFRLKSSSEQMESLSKEKRKLQMKLEVLSRKLKEVDSQNQELTETMARQEVVLLLSKDQLEERSRESTALSRQLEAALRDVRKKVSEVKDQTAAGERALLSKILSLESELNGKTKELKQLQRNKDNTEMSHKMHLQELKLSLEQSESQNQSIQNYVQFLKMSYATMFGESTLTEFHAEPTLR